MTSRIPKASSVPAIAFLFLLACACFQAATAHAATPSVDEQLAAIRSNTGLDSVGDDGNGTPILGKIHRGHAVVVRFRMGDVWGRYVARLGASEMSKELHGYWQQLARAPGNTPVGSPLDRMLSDAIGYPIEIVAALDHGKAKASPLAIIAERAPFSATELKPLDAPRLGHLNFYGDAALAGKIADDAALVKRLKGMRSCSIRVEGNSVVFAFAGDEMQYSAMIRESGGYYGMLNGILDSLADIGEKL